MRNPRIDADGHTSPKREREGVRGAGRPLRTEIDATLSLALRAVKAFP
jgi:hypothetical protein